MRCPDCEYPLWNLTARACPECGRQFAPSDFEFVPSSVRFCCPQCDQPYYGTTPQGHLEPDEFDCVSCGRHVTMNDMVLRPAAGVHEESTRPSVNPWLERQRIGFMRGWFKTIGSALVSPGKLIIGTEPGSSLGQAFWFFSLTTFVMVLVSMVPMLCFMALPLFITPPGGGGPPAGAMAGMMFFTSGIMLVAMFVALLVYVPLWAVTVQGLLHLTGGGVEPIRRTMQSLLYSGGTIITSIVPCLGNAAFVWWLVSAVLAVKDAHRIGGGRASFAVLTFPVALAVGLGTLYIALITVGITASASRAGAIVTAPRTETQLVTSAVLQHAAANNGAGPSHAAVLTIDGTLSQYDFVSTRTRTDTGDIPIAGRNLFDISTMDEETRTALIEQEAAGQPSSVVAHRVGDFVFTYHGIDLDVADTRLWVVILTPDTSVRRSRRATVAVGRADGTVREFPVADLAVQLSIQNGVRRQAGLPPLPDPLQVTHGNPVTEK